MKTINMNYIQIEISYRSSGRRTPPKFPDYYKIATAHLVSISRKFIEL